jgi:uncharacterized membrane protein YeiB
VGTIATVVTTSLTLYALVATIFLISENRRPQATLAWMLVFFFIPGLGVVIYVLFGRDTKAFSKRRRLLMQDLETNFRLLLEPILMRQDEEIARLETESTSHRRLMMLVRRNSRSVLTRRNAESFWSQPAGRTMSSMKGPSRPIACLGLEGRTGCRGVEDAFDGTKARSLPGQHQGR